MRVKATSRGFVYWMRHPGEVFEIAEHLFSKDWMEKIEATDDAAKTASPTPTAPAIAPSVAQSAGPTATAEPNLPGAADPKVTGPQNAAAVAQEPK